MKADAYETQRAEIADLKARLEEAEETLRAIRSGEVDALVVGEQVYTLESAEAASNRFRGGVLAQINDAVIAVDIEQRVTYLNPAAERLYGISASESLGLFLEEVHERRWLRPEDAEASKQTLSTTGAWRGESIHIKRSGEEIHVESSISPMIDRNGAVTGLLAVNRDITARKRAEEKARETQAELTRTTALLHAVSETTTHLIYVKDRESRLLLANPALLRVIGKASSEVIGKNAAEYHDDQEQAAAIMKNDQWVLRSGETLHVEEIFTGSDGQTRSYLSSKSPLRDDLNAIVGVIGVTHDITETKRAGQALRDSELLLKSQKALLESVTESVLDGILVVSLTGEILHMNQRFRDLWKSADSSTPFQMEGKAWWADSLVADSSTFEARIAKIYAHPEKTFREEVLMKDGRVYDIFGSAIQRDRLRYGWVFTFRDVSAEKKAQARLAEAQAQLQKHASTLEQTVAERTAKLQETISELESFSYSISHDMRAPLRAMQSFASFLRTDYSDALDAEGKEYIRRIVAAADRMDRLIQDVLVYSRVARSEVALERIELGSFLHGIIESYPQFNSTHAIIEIVAPLAAVQANQAALTQCVSNLVGNGIKFVAEGTTPKIRIWTEVTGKRVRLFIKDNGIGIPRSLHEKIFGIFQQVDSRRGGTGIGLAVVRKAAERMGGSITVESEAGQGSTFCLELNLGKPR